MAVVKELIRTEENGTISFGDYEKNQKSKVSDYPHQGDMYKVKHSRRSPSWNATVCLYMSPYQVPLYSILHRTETR